MQGTPRALQSASSYCQSNEHYEVASGVKSPLYLLQQETPTLPRVRPQDTTPAQPGLSPRELGAGRSPPLCLSVRGTQSDPLDAKILHDSTSIEGLSGLSKPIDSSQRSSTSKQHLRCQCMQQAISSPSAMDVACRLLLKGGDTSIAGESQIHLQVRSQFMRAASLI